MADLKLGLSISQRRRSYSYTQCPLAALECICPENLEDILILCSRQMLNENGLSRRQGYDYAKLNVVITFNFINTPALMVEEGAGDAFTFDKLVNISGDSELCF